MQLRSPSRIGPRRRRHVALLIELAVATTIGSLLLPANAGAHSPHDVVTQVAVQHLQTGLPVLYALVRGIAVSTSDLGRTWARMSAGIWRHRLEDLVVGADGSLAVTDGHRILVRPSGSQNWAPISVDVEQGQHIHLASGSSGIYAHVGDVLYRVRTDLSAVAHDVATIDGSGVYASSDGEVSSVDSSVPLGRTVPSPSYVCLEDSNVYASSGRAIFRGRELIHTAEAEVTGLCAVGATVVATLERDNCITSLDSGKSWQSCIGLTTDPQADEEGFKKPHFSSVTAFTHIGKPHFVIGGFDGLFLSSDGLSWRESHGVLPRSMVSALDANAERVNVTTYGGGLSRVEAGVESPVHSPPSKRLFSTAQAEDGTQIITHASGALRSANGGATWSPVTIGSSSGSAGLRQRLKHQAKKVAIEVGGRLGTTALERLRSAYKDSLASKPQHEKLPFFGSIVLAPNNPSEPWLLVAKPSGVLRSDDHGKSFQPWLRMDPGGTLGLARVAETTMVLSPTSVFVCRGGSSWIERNRPPGGVLDSIASWGSRFVIGTDSGLFTSSDDGDNWEEVDATAIAALAVGEADSLLVQYDDGRIDRLVDSGAVPIAPKGTPILRHAVSFPDMAPMMAETQSAIVGSDHYSILMIDDRGVQPVSRCSMLHADRHELMLHGSWKIRPANDAHGGVRAVSQSAGRVDVWANGRTAVLHMSPTSPPPVGATLDHDRIEIGESIDGRMGIDLADVDGEQLLSIAVPDGFSFDGIELREFS